jgi:L-ribulose-5-phosphate 3-epimerase
MKIGIRAHDFGRLALEEMIDKIKSRGFSAVQLALNKALTEVDADSHLSPGLAYHVGETFRKNDIQITILGCYFNPLAEEEERKKAVARFKEHIRYARSLGCSVVATETGSVNADWSFHPDNHGEEAFVKVVETVKELVREAERFGVFVGIEGVIRHTIHSPQKLKRLIDEVNSNNLQIVFDPVNLLDINNYKRQDEIIRQSIELFGDRIVAVHSKDFIVEGNEFKTVPAGTGLLNYKLIFELLNKKKPFVNFIMEELSEEEMQQGIDFFKVQK